MQFPIPQITSLVLLAHLVLGCCWHHSHGPRLQGGPAATAGSCGDCHADHHAVADLARHDQDPSEPGAPPYTPGQDTCELGRCAFLRSERSPVVEGQWQGRLGWETVQPVSDVAGCRSSAATLTPSRDAAASTSPRLHLQLRILLI